MRILVFATDLLPLPGLPTSGTALRTSGFIAGFKNLGHEVHCAVPRQALALAQAKGALKNFSTEVVANLSALAFDSTNQEALAAQVAPDLIFCGHWPAYIFPKAPPVPVVVDLAGPHLLERHYQGSPNRTDSLFGKLTVFASADYFITSGPRQKEYFRSFFERTGRSDFNQASTEIPMPLSENSPCAENSKRSSRNYPHFIFGGVFLPWQDPTQALTNLSEFLAAKQTGKLTLIGGVHPHYPVHSGVYQKLFSKLELNPQVTRKPLMPFEEFASELASADVALDLMAWNLERELALTIRSTTYLWAGLPVIYNDFSDLSDLIRQYDAGWTVSPADLSAQQNIFSEISANPESVKKKAKNALRLAAAEFNASKSAQKVLDLLGAPRTALADIVYMDCEQRDTAIWKNSAVSTFFRARRNSLSRIDLRLSTRFNPPDAPLEVTISSASDFESSQADLKFQTTLAPESIPEDDWYSIHLPMIQTDQLLRLDLRSQASAPDCAVYVWGMNHSPDPLMGSIKDGKFTKNYAVCMRTFS
ncbi:hypothetical protein JNK13_09425 [bacterium]|nr:hypothetical protein [bacterium]